MQLNHIKRWHPGEDGARADARAQERFIKNIVVSYQSETWSPTKQILDMLTKNGALTDAGQNIIERNLSDFEINYAYWGPGVDIFCHCTSRESSAWSAGIDANTAKDRMLRPAIPALLRCFFESFSSLFSEKRHLMSEGTWWNQTYEVDEMVAGTQKKSFARAKEDFVGALWRYLLAYDSK